MGSWEFLEESWSKLTLLGEGDEPIALDEEQTEEDSFKESRSLLGKLCIDRGIGKEILKATMGKVWRISTPANFKEVGKNLFTITFATESDKP